MAFTPVFIIGVPRSGTTLLRVLLDSHSEIAALPESPWLLGAYGGDCSLRSLILDMIEGPYGIVRNISGVDEQHVLAAGRRLLDELFEPFMRRQGKRLLVFKTPDDIPHLDFLLRLMPDAHYIHITRDGRDVCKSQLAKKGSFFDDLKSYGRLSYANAFRRWVEWERHIRATLYRPGGRVCHIRYEDLIADPRAELERVTAFLGAEFEPGMLDYASVRHDYPGWEAGSTDVARREGISKASVGQWRDDRMTTEKRYVLRKYDSFVTEIGYPSSGIAPSPFDRLKMALFPATQPVLDGGWRTWRRLRRDARSRFRRMTKLAALAGLLALAACFLTPLWETRASSEAAYRPAACFVAAIAVAIAAGPSLAGGARPHAYERALSIAAIAMLAYIGVLELAQGFASDRRTGLSQFLLDASGAAIGFALTGAMVRNAKGRLGRMLKGGGGVG